jgi:histidyl-tRNA synthetase
VCAYLDAAGLPYAINPRIVRGLDYYTRTVFEFTSGALGAQSTVCGGGRYDGLFESLGGPPTPAVGFGLGLERFLMILKATGREQLPPRRGFQAIALGVAARTWLFPVVAALRAIGREPANMDFADRKLTAQFKIADRNGARYALIVGDDELAAGKIVVRDLVSREDRAIAAASTAEDTARALVEAIG